MTNGNGAPVEQAAPQLNVLAQYTKDLSFENPNAPASLGQQQQQEAFNAKQATEFQQAANYGDQIRSRGYDDRLKGMTAQAPKAVKYNGLWFERNPLTGEQAKMIDPATGKPQIDDKNTNKALAQRPIVGINIFNAMRSVADKKWSGTIYNADDGKTYSSDLELAGTKKLEVRGCVLAVLCGGETWTKVGEITVASVNQ